MQRPLRGVRRYRFQWPLKVETGALEWKGRKSIFKGLSHEIDLAFDDIYG